MSYWSCQVHGASSALIFLAASLCEQRSVLCFVLVCHRICRKNFVRLVSWGYCIILSQWLYNWRTFHWFFDVDSRAQWRNLSTNLNLVNELDISLVRRTRWSGTRLRSVVGPERLVPIICRTLVASPERGEWDQVLTQLSSYLHGGRVPRLSLSRLGSISRTRSRNLRPRWERTINICNMPSVI